MGENWKMTGGKEKGKKKTVGSAVALASSVLDTNGGIKELFYFLNKCTRKFAFGVLSYRSLTFCLFIYLIFKLKEMAEIPKASISL